MYRTPQVPTIPTVTIFVRHSADCAKKNDSFAKGCRCPKHLRWSHGGKEHRASAKTRTWSIAEQRRREVEAQFDPTQQTPAAPTTSRNTIAQAVGLFISSKRSQGIESDVLSKYERELGRVTLFMKNRSRHFPDEVRLEDLTEFRAGWAAMYPSSTTRSKVQERLKSFLRYCYNSKMIDRVPYMSPIQVESPPTLPLTESQYKNLLSSSITEFDVAKGRRVRALVQLMRYSGLSIRDAVTLRRNELFKDKTLYRVVTSRQKTGTHVSVLLPPGLGEEVLAAHSLNSNPEFVFWNTGTGEEQSAVTNWQHDLRKAFRAAKMEQGHPHQLRDTFAVSLLEKGVPMEEVSKALGHTSIKTTEKYYAKWEQKRQDRLDALLRGTF